VTKKDDKVILTCNRNSLGEPDASGRRRPVPVKGSEFEVEYDTIIAAIGQIPDIPAGFKVTTGRNSIQAKAGTMETNITGVWAGGDAVTGTDNVALSVIRAIAHGRVAASSIDKFLGGTGNIEEELTLERNIGKCAGKTPEGFVPQKRVKMPCLPPEKVKDNFTEVELGLYNDEAIAEGKRCFQCGFRYQITPPPCPPDVHKRRAWEMENLKPRA
jgi:NADPH-dependent glutamate synthase beta subunit-like oxidoreductase